MNMIMKVVAFVALLFNRNFNLMRVGLYIGGLAIALCTLLYAPPAMAQSDPCVPTTDDSVSISVSGDCSIAGDIVATSGDVNITANGGTLTITGQVSAAGNVYISGDSGVIVSGDTNAGGGAVTAASSGGLISLTTVESSVGIGLTANSDIDTGAISAGVGFTATSSSGGIDISGSITTNGDVTFTAQNEVDIESTIQAGGYLTITSNNDKITLEDMASSLYDTELMANTDVDTQALNSGGYLTVTSTTGEIDLGDAVTSVYDSNLMAQNNVHAESTLSSQGLLSVTSQNGQITFDDTATSNHGAVFAAYGSVSLQDVINEVGYGDVRIFANQGGAGGVFTIGGDTGNSVTSITENTPSGGQTVYVTNLAPSGLAYTGSNSIQVSAGDGTSDTIVLDGQNGQTPVSLSGSLSADGSSQGGNIDIFASEIDVTGDTLLSASAPGATVGGMNLISNAENLSGSLTINLNGTSPSYIILAMNPVNSWSVSAPTDLDDYISYGDFTSSAEPVNVSGEGALTINSTGDNNGLKLWGYPLSLTSSSFTVNMSGAGNSITIDGWDGDETENAVNLSGDIQVHVNTNAAGQTPGSIETSGTTIGPAPLSGNVLYDASGTSGGDGGAIYFNPESGESDFGGTGSYFTLNANGSSSGGSGGTIQASGDQFYVENANAITASAVAGNGNGGTVTLYIDDLYFEEADASLAVNGYGTGNGGSLTINAYDSMENAGGSLSANGGATSGNGGSIALNVYNDLNFEATNASLTANGGATGNGGSVYLSSSTLEFTGTSSSIAANGGSTSGNGGTVTVYSSSDLTLGSGSSGGVLLSATAPGTGNTTANNGGSIDVEYQDSVSVDGGSVTVTAGGNANGGTINFSNLGQLTVTGTLAADGAGDGNGGSITLAPTSNTMTLDSSTISVSGASSGNGNGNELSISNGSSPISMDGTTVAANGGGSGNGGSINISTTDDITGGADIEIEGGCSEGNGGTLTLTGNNVYTSSIQGSSGSGTACAALRASRSGNLRPQLSAGTGIGGTTTITSTAAWVAASGAPINMDGSGSGAGGTITVTNSSAISLAGFAENSLTARGGDSGAGGSVSILHVGQFDVNYVINVSAGASAGTTIPDGSISLNSQTCQQYKLNTTSTFPSSYWNCTGNTPPTTTDLVPSTIAAGLTNLTTLLSGQNALIYVFPSATEFNNYFVDSLSTAAGGLTFKQLSSGVATNYLYVAPFESGNLEDNTNHAYTMQQYMEVSGHEIGHAIDITFGTPSTTAGYQSYAYRDLYNLDMVLDTTVTPNVYVQRLPCVATPLHSGVSSDTPPFLNITNVGTGNPVCLSGALNPTDFPNPPYNSNSWVFQSIDSGFWKSPPDLFGEAHAQTFAVQSVGAQGARPMFDGVFATTAPSILGSTYFGCMKAYATAEIAGTNGPSTAPDSCGTTPSGYTPFVR